MHFYLTFAAKVRIDHIPISRLLCSVMDFEAAMQKTLISSGISILPALTQRNRVYTLILWAAPQMQKTWICKLFLLNSLSRFVF